MKSIFTIFLLCILASCSTPDETSEEQSELINNIEVVSMDPNFGYPGDEITFILSENLPSNATVSVKYEDESATITKKEGNSVTHIMPENNNGQVKLVINNREIFVDQLWRPKKIFNCTDCKEKIFRFDEGTTSSGAIGAFHVSNKVYIIKVKEDRNYNYITSLVELDNNLNVIKETNLFNTKTISKIIFNPTNFVLSNENGVYSYDYNGIQKWKFDTQIGAGLGSTYFGFVYPNIIKFNSHYYVIKNTQYSIHEDSKPLEISKLNESGQLVKSIQFKKAENDDHEAMTASFLAQIDNKLVVFTNYVGGDYDQAGYVIIDSNDNILRNMINYYKMYDTDLYSEGNSIYFIEENLIFKASLNSENYIESNQIAGGGYGGVILKYQEKYLIGAQNQISVFNNNNFTSPQIVRTRLNSFEGIRIDNYNIVGDYIYFFGQRVLEWNEYRAFVGRYSLKDLIQ